MSLAKTKHHFLYCINPIGLSADPIPNERGFFNSTLRAGAILVMVDSKKLLVNVEIGSFDQVLSYLVVVYAAFAGLVAILVFVFWLMHGSIDPHSLSLLWRTTLPLTI